MKNKTTIFLFILTALITSCLYAEEPAENPNKTGLETDAEQTLTIDPKLLTAKNSPENVSVIGSVDPESNFTMELAISSKGASIEQARLNGFFERGSETEPLVAMKPVTGTGGQTILPLSARYLTIEGSGLMLPLYKLDWKFTGVRGGSSGSQNIELEAVYMLEDKEFIKVTRTYTLLPALKHFTCTDTIKNLSDMPLKLSYDIQSPTGFAREAVRTDARKILTGYTKADGTGIVSGTIDITKMRKQAVEYLNNPIPENKITIERPKEAARLRWTAVSNKYFTGIMIPDSLNEQNELAPFEIKELNYYFDGLQKGLSLKQQPKAYDRDNVGHVLTYEKIELAPGESESRVTNIYLGPKVKAIFENDEYYRSIGLIHTIDFRMCCGNLFRPISFAILALMKTMYAVIPNYGIIIIILVLLVRTCLHPLTKSGQVSMMKMGKLGPKMEELKKKYGDNKAELQRAMAELYREQGASPIKGMLPMFIQMPIWIALYSAIYASIDLRGAKFLPFWITDLSAPDALVSFSPVEIPLLGWELTAFNLLPILLGVAMFLQQKLMSTTSTAAANPQMQQQQKMMLWMMPIMMLIFLYNAPSGLNLYIMTSVFGGVIEQKVIRKHIQEKEEQEARGKVPVTSKTGGKAKKKKPKPLFKNS
ncbi:Oxa1Ec [Limihaloglobus sulfuriphilus]|uniref:Membrane protein insertase YidC n=1 Tax=Limihaloglobus sulfuriphilus TaxID=1851148 RepID=A0A1Q2MCF5_9BACT|nr:YidC/Oxa1 family insertase periplasmic-domain containing protein [Limihaloglobus sulfuriphilus]AQQ70344.1 Oxa1Ec [Limihaloglobus sulfuriphilus]